MFETFLIELELKNYVNNQKILNFIIIIFISNTKKATVNELFEFQRDHFKNWFVWLSHNVIQFLSFQKYNLKQN